jgi:heme oxygenase (mycobilin-producing)
VFIICNRMLVNPEYAEAFEKRFADRASLVDKMPGFVSFQLMRPKTEGAPYVVMTTWESEDDFKAWTESPEFKEGHARSGTLPPQTFAGASKMEMFEVIQNTAKTERAAE